jgi:polyphenol oxidase
MSTAAGACYSQFLARDSLQLVSRNGLTWLESTALARFPWLGHGFSTRLAPATGLGGAPRRQRGDFNLGLTPGARPRSIEKNRRLFSNTLGPFPGTASLKQIHSALVYQIAGPCSDTAPPGPGHPLPLDYRPAGYALPVHSQRNTTPAAPQQDIHAGDALLTAKSGVLLTIRMADCLPVLIADTRLRVVAAIHAGWRGALARIVEKTVGELRRVFSSNPRDQVAVLGPSIGRCCYEVGEEVVEAFAGQFVESDAFFCKPVQRDQGNNAERYTALFHTQASPGHARPRPALYLDLAAAARFQLVAAGLKPSAIHDTAYCTACRADLFFSHRREGSRAGRMMAAIGVRE